MFSLHPLYFSSVCVFFCLGPSPQVYVALYENQIDSVNGSYVGIGCTTPLVSTVTEDGYFSVCGTDNYLVDGCSPELDTQASDWASELVTLRRNEGSIVLPFPNVFVSFVFDRPISPTGIEIDFFLCPEWNIGTDEVLAYFNDVATNSTLFALPDTPSAQSCESLSTLMITPPVPGSLYSDIHLLFDLSVNPNIEWVHIGDVRFLGSDIQPSPSCVPPTAVTPDGEY